MTTGRTRTTRTTTLAAVALAGLLGLSACGDSGGTPAAGGGSSQTAADAAYNAQDVAFVKDMKPHHEQAVEMADMVLAKDPSPQVRALATKVKAAQEPEIAQLDAMLAEFGVDGGSSSGHGGGHGGGHSTSGGSAMGMMSIEDMKALEAASGAQAERLFLQGMLEHHEGAVDMATQEIEGGEYPQAIALAKTIKADQQAEIAEMQQLLGKA